MAWHVASRFGNGSIINALALSGLQFEEGAQVQREEACEEEEGVWESALQMAPVHDVLHDEVATLASIKLIKVMLHFKE